MPSRDPENLMQSLMREEELTVGDLHYHWQTPSFLTTDAMDFDSILNNCQPEPSPTQYTAASPDLSTGTFAQLPPACLPATSPLQSSAPFHLKVPPINNATGGNASSVNCWWRAFATVLL